jgi:hypothetical protein
MITKERLEELIKQEATIYLEDNLFILLNTIVAS